MRMLVIGYGNPTRSDDGAGHYVVSQIEKKRIHGLETRITQQLNLELLEEAAHYEKIIFVDAREGGSEIQIRKVKANPGAPASSHFLTPETLSVFAQKVYGLNPDWWVCSIRGENFELGLEMTPECFLRASRAVNVIRTLLSKETCHA